MAGPVLVALLGTGISILAFPALPRQGDSFQYLMAARWVLGEAEYTGAYHPAGYPVLLAVLVKLGGWAFGPLLVLTQHALRLLPLVVFALLPRWGIDRRVAGAAAFVWALAPEGLVFAHVVMAESVATGLAAVALLALLAHAARPSPRRAAVAGAAIGLLALFKSVGAAWLLPALLVRPAGRRPRRVPAVLAALAGFALVTGGMAVWQRARAGFWIVPASPAAHLFSRVVAEGGLLPAGDPGLAALNAMVARARNAPAQHVWNYDRTLDALGVPRADRDRIYLGLAVRGITQAPWAYVAGTFTGCAELCAWSPVVPAGASTYRATEYRLAVPRSLDEAVADLAPVVPDPDALAWMLGQLGSAFDPGLATEILARWVAGWRAVLSVIRWPWVLLAVAGAVALARDRRARPAGPVITGCVALWLLGHAAFEMAVPRYGLPVQPLIGLLACAGLAAVVRMTGRR